MNDIINGVLISLIPSVLISILTSILTVKLSLSQFYSQKWWEKKAEAYSNIIESLSHLKYCLDKLFDDEIGVIELNESDQNEMFDVIKKAKEHLIKTSNMGAYIISDESTTELKQLIRELNKEDPERNWVQDLDNYSGSVKICISRIRKLAKSELKGK
jgi:hypothetical protein